jgi:hypothetical protein
MIIHFVDVFAFPQMGQKLRFQMSFNQPEAKGNHPAPPLHQPLFTRLNLPEEKEVTAQNRAGDAPFFPTFLLSQNNLTTKSFKNMSIATKRGKTLVLVYVCFMTNMQFLLNE